MNILKECLENHCLKNEYCMLNVIYLVALLARLISLVDNFNV